jgi:hypothetical protein
MINNSVTENYISAPWNSSCSRTSKNHQHKLDRHLRILSSKGLKNQIFKDYVAYLFDSVFTPAYFGTVCWTPFIFHFEETVKETRHFKNKLLTAIYNCRLHQVPKLPTRSRIIFFHEVKDTLINPKSSSPKFKLTFHTHFHIEGLDLIQNAIHLDALTQSQVRPRFNRLNRKDTAANKAIVIKPWIHEFHTAYNVKDYYSRQNCQDGDLVIDYDNSDLG